MTEPRRSLVGPLLAAVVVAGGFLVWTLLWDAGTLDVGGDLPAAARPGSVGGGPASGLVVVIGDFGVGSSAQYEVARGIESLARISRVDAVVTTGDNLYIDDVDTAWEVPYGWLEERGIPVLAAWGNHDVETARRANLVASLFGVERYSTAGWYDATFVFLDANAPGDPVQQAWLEATLSELATDLVVVVFHQTAVSCSKHGSLPELAHWLPIFERFDVDLVLQGHDHNYQHHVRNGIDYVVTGGGGYDLYPVTDCPDGSKPEATAEEHHYLTLEQGQHGLTVNAVRPDLTLIDSFEVGGEPG